ncbi:piggyBac transposable element-derived protein 3-like [Anabrus simplex]|uniref:piggyBac transposable element-derived protein 3-like n=1 Tax=Anabrus simplex TaxID=316456 RepID=UPI0035A398C8
MSSDSDSESSDSSPHSERDAIPCENQNKPIKKSRELKWKAQDFNPTPNCAEDLDWEVNGRDHWTPLDYFNEYFDDDFWNLVADQSNRRALQDNVSKPLRATAGEYKMLVGAHIITGVLKLPRLRLYYRPNLRIPAVVQIPRDRFYRLRNYLHFVDNLAVTDEVRKENRLWKVQPVIDVVKNVCNKLPRCMNLSIDEQMIPFSGTTKLKQYVKGKPNPVGLKNYVLASPQGLVLDFFIYQGANTWPDGKPNQEYGIGGSVVLKLTENLNRGHVLYFDRYFTSVPILEHLLNRGIYATGTIQANRLQKDLKLKLSSDQALQKRGRGSYDEFVREDGSISILKWMDNRSVLMASSATGAKPLQYIRRWDKREKKYILVPCPKTVPSYNHSMGGVDLCDRMIAFYRIIMRTRKWPVRVFWHFIDLAIVNS